MAEQNIKVLNLYSGIGGNRKLWENVDVTAVEIEPKIAAIYQDFFPDDKVIIADAHQYLLDHYSEFDFIWSSPPCPSHSRVRFVATYNKKGDIRQKPLFPDMKLYEEIVFLQNYFKGKYCVENVVAFYKPLIEPQKRGLHYYWTNFVITKWEANTRGHYEEIDILSKRKKVDLSKYNLPKYTKQLILRNCVEPEAGYHIFNCAYPDNKITLKDYYKQGVLI